LFRGRRSLRDLARKNYEISTPKSRTVLDSKLVNMYVECFNTRDFDGISKLLGEHAVFNFVTQSSKEYGRDTIMNASHNPSHYQRSDLKAVLIDLWGRQTIVFYKVSETGTPIALNEVLAIETEDAQIVRINGYFFCPEFMDEAAKELGIPREEWK
jgi:hypothetical protein